MSEEETERREKRNRARLEALVHASEELLQRLLRDAFSAKHRRVKWDGGACVAAAYPQLTATLKPIQRKQLTAGDASKWDLTLLHAVLLYVVTGKSKAAKTQRQAISKIVNVRNLCAHAAGGRVEDAAFATHAQTIEAAYVALGGDRDAIQAALRQADADGDAPLPTYDERATQEALSHKRDGNAAFAQQDFHDARRIYSRGLDVEGAVDPRVLAELHSNRSSACCRLRDFASAKIDARRAAELAPMWPKPHARLGELWVAQGKHRKAVASFETALRLARDALTGDGDTASGRALLASVERQVASARLLVDKDDRRESEDLAYDSQFRSEGAYREALQARMGLASSHDPNEIARAFVSLDLEKKEGFGNMKQVVNAHLALQDGRLHDAARGFLAAAVAGNAEGMYNYAVMVSNGRGVAMDIAQAVEWLEKAAAMTPSPSRDARHLNIGIGEAMASLGRYYDLGIHFKQSDSKAVEYWEKAARMGVAAGLNSLATCYMDGHHGMRQDLAKARDLLRPSAEKLQNEAMTNIAVVHAAIQDFSTAARWAATAARFGYMPALQMAAEYKRQSAHDAKATANWDLLRSISRLQRGHWENSDAGPVVDVFRPTLVDLRAIGTPYATRLANALSQLTEAKLLISRGQLKAGLDLAAKALRVPHALGLLTDDQEEFFATASRELVKRGQPIDTTLTVFVALNSSQFALDCANIMRRKGLYDPVVVQLAALACFHSERVAESITLFQYALTKVPHPERDEDPATMQLLFDLANAYFVSEQHDAASRFASRFLAVAVADGHRLASEVHFMLGIITVVQASEAKRKKRSEELKTVALTHLRDGLVLSANLPECFREGSKSMAQRMLEMAAVLESPCPELLASDTSSFEELTQRGGELVFGHRRHPALIRSESDPADDFRLVDSWRKKGAEWGNLMQREEKGRLSKTMTMMPPAMSSARVAQGPLRPASVDELLSGLQDRVYSDRRLDAIVVAEAYFTGASYSLIVEDSQREPVRLAVYNASGQFIKQLAPGRVISLRSPYVRITQEGEIMIRVERPDVAIQLEELFVVCWACSLHLTSAPQIRCSHCSTARYCSEQCKARDWEVYGHQYWCSRTIDDDAGAPVSSKKKKKKKQKKEKKVKPEQVESAPVGRETEPLVESSENQLNILVEPLPETELLDESCETQLDTPAEPQPFAVARDPNTVKPPQSDCCIS